LDQLRLGGLKPTRGDTRCIIFGHLVRMAVWNLRTTWDNAQPAQGKLAAVGSHMASLPRPEEIEHLLATKELPALRYAVHETPAPYAGDDGISF
ncbi:MAG TPA: hypothetical protein VIH45_02585, partial [Desulfuromonadaceae bacterium]